jgi:RNA polymerase sigma-70 factor, ECF subfamily
VTAARFEAFVLEFQDMVYATAMRLLANPTEAEDLAQTVFLKAFERYDQVVGNPSAPGWLKTVTTHECLNHLSRYRNRWRFFSEMPAEPNPAAAPVSAGVDERLDAALRALPPHQRVLFHFDELSYQQIADRLGVSVTKVKSDIHRGRQALRLVLDADNAVGRGRR